jgi:hypothetical protein
MQQFRIPTPLIFNTIEFLKFQLGLFITKIALTDTQKTVLVFFYLYPNPVDELVSQKIFKSRKSAENYVSDLRKSMLLIGKGSDTKLNPAIRLKNDSFELTMQVHHAPE